ncbi:hypothetical protein FRC19_005446 [Serendipita sp. 401]|nr:hypothetical protein FRC15_000580 [Serendipita sp. 397]KAG8822689.1 hypothetical protein FRC19_005446 [Serendipita sp. 401]KAG8870697.1 hypothetical protein FRC20_011426 [Serendipita sp. 405]
MNQHINVVPIVQPPTWDTYASPDHNLRRIFEENRRQLLESRKQMVEIQGLVSAIFRKLEESEDKIFKEIKHLEESISGITSSIPGQYTYPQADLEECAIVEEANPEFQPPSPAPTALCEEIAVPVPGALDNSLEGKVTSSNIRHPFKGNAPTHSQSKDTRVQLPSAQRTIVRWIHTLSPHHRPQSVEYSPYGKIGEGNRRAVSHNANRPRIKDGDDQIMGFMSQECDRFPVTLGGFSEPLVPGRHKDEPDVIQAYVFRVRRWGARIGTRLYRLPISKFLSSAESGAPPITQIVLEQRQRTWSITHKVWYRFVSDVSPSRFPGLSEQCWEDILDTPPEQTRSAFLQTLNRYVGYAGTETLSEPLPSIIPELMQEFEKAVHSPFPCSNRPNETLLAELDVFEARRTLETVDATYLWRAVLWSVFPKHCMKHLRNNAVGGSDPRWSIVHAEYTERFERRKGIWDEISRYRFPNGSYLPNYGLNRDQDKQKQLKVLVHESLSFSRLLVGWKGGTVALRHLVIPHLVELGEKPEPLTEEDVERWMKLHEDVQQFYETKIATSQDQVL